MVVAFFRRVFISAKSPSFAPNGIGARRGPVRCGDIVSHLGFEMHAALPERVERKLAVCSGDGTVVPMAAHLIKEFGRLAQSVFPDEELPTHVLGCAGARFSLRSWETWRSQEACGSRRFFETRSGGIAVDGLAEAAGGPAACDPHGVRFSGSNLQLKTAGRTESASGVAYGGAAENRTPVHDSSLIGISRLSHSFSLGRLARSDTLSASQPVRS